MQNKIGDFLNNLESITEQMTGPKSFYEAQMAEVQQLFLDYGFTNIEKSEIMARMVESSTNYINQYATSGAMELLKIEREDEKLAIEIKLIEAQIKLTEAQTKVATCQAETCELKKTLIPLEEDKISREILDIEERTRLSVAQQALLKRQTKNYDDNLLVKSAEFQGGLASYSVNAASKNAQNAINEFLTTIGEIKART